MSTITHIAADEITDLTTLYIDAKIGTVIAINDLGDNIGLIWEDANGEHDTVLDPAQEIPTLVG